MPGASIPQRLVLPAPEAVAQMITGLLGRHVTGKKSTPVAWNPKAQKDASVLAVYVRDDGSYRGVTISDTAAVCMVGAALTLHPIADASACLKAGKWSEGLMENYREVLNVAANLFNMPGAPHTRLRKVCLPGEAVPEEVEAALRKPAGRQDVEVTVAGYGSGRLSIVAF